MTVCADGAQKRAVAELPSEEEAEDNRKLQCKNMIDKQIRKTRLCQYHMSGACKYGSKCTFAHQIHELQRSPDLRKTRICKAFMKGGCNNSQCKFAHGQDELRSTEFCFKTTICVWHAQGKCMNGSRCRFAHGSSELRRSGNHSAHSSDDGSSEFPASQQQTYHDSVKVQPTPFLQAFSNPLAGNATRARDDPQLSMLYNVAYLSALEELSSDLEQRRLCQTTAGSLQSSPINKELSGHLDLGSPLSGYMQAPTVFPMSKQFHNQLGYQAHSSIANQVASHVANQQLMNNLSMLEQQQIWTQMKCDQLAKCLDIYAPALGNAGPSSMPTQAPATTAAAALFSQLARAATERDGHIACESKSWAPFHASTRDPLNKANPTSEDGIGIADRLSILSEQLLSLQQQMEAVCNPKNS